MSFGLKRNKKYCIKIYISMIFEHIQLYNIPLKYFYDDFDHK